MWFSILWRILKGILNEATQKKIRIASSSESFAALSEFVDAENIPTEVGFLSTHLINNRGDSSRTSPTHLLNQKQYGGKLEDCQHHSPQEENLRAFVEAVNAAHPPGSPYPPVAPRQGGGGKKGEEP